MEKGSSEVNHSIRPEFVYRKDRKEVKLPYFFDMVFQDKKENEFQIELTSVYFEGKRLALEDIEKTEFIFWDNYFEFQSKNKGNAFLEYHLDFYINGSNGTLLDFSTFLRSQLSRIRREFLKDQLNWYKSIWMSNVLFEDSNEIVEYWMNSKVDKNELDVINRKKRTKKEGVIDLSKQTLKDIFKSEKEYDFIIALLIKEKWIAPVTFINIDSEGSYRKWYCCLLKTLFISGYYKEKPTNEDLVKIALNTFKVKISVDLMKKTKADDVVLGLDIP
jgi:hypothetical protein